VKIQSLGLDLLTGRKRDHHVVDDVVVLGKGMVARAQDPLVWTDHGIVGHVVHFCIDIFFLIATSENVIFNITLLVFACIF
jgi:hypothetical protein